MILFWYLNFGFKIIEIVLMFKFVYVERVFEFNLIYILEVVGVIGVYFGLYLELRLIFCSWFGCFVLIGYRCGMFSCDKRYSWCIDVMCI